MKANKTDCVTLWGGWHNGCSIISCVT